jgi:hypothetical protein
MTIAKTSALTVGFLCAIAFGILIGPTVTKWKTSVKAPSWVQAPFASSGSTEGQPVAEARPKAARSKTVVVPVSAPELQDRLKPLLNKGANMTVAAEGFRDAEQFATVAHAARNTDVPFLLLKHRVLNEGKSVASAIRASKPEANASVEANLARAQARSDIAAIAG